MIAWSIISQEGNYNTLEIYFLLPKGELPKLIFDEG